MKGISFKNKMVLPTMAGTKTQTRRLVKPQPELIPVPAWKKQQHHEYSFKIPRAEEPQMIWKGHHTSEHACSRLIEGAARYQPGDICYVKEAIRISVSGGIIYDCDDGKPSESYRLSWKWKPNKLAAMYMPAYLARTHIQIKAVRVERLHEIQNRPLDIVAEGMPKDTHLGDIQWYRNLWIEINGQKSWDANPYLYVYTFALHAL